MNEIDVMKTPDVVDTCQTGVVEGDRTPGTPSDGTPRDGTANPPAYGPGSGFHGKPGRSGPPKGNRNNLRHGLKAGNLPKGCRGIENHVNILRREIEDAIIAKKGEVGITDAATVHTIVRWERHAMLCTYWLRKEADNLSACDRFRFSEAIGKASESRDRSIRLLDLDKKASVWDSLYGQPAIGQALRAHTTLTNGDSPTEPATTPHDAANGQETANGSAGTDTCDTSREEPSHRGGGVTIT
jgi:hypothetical protein